MRAERQADRVRGLPSIDRSGRGSEWWCDTAGGVAVPWPPPRRTFRPRTFPPSLAGAGAHAGAATVHLTVAHAPTGLVQSQSTLDRWHTSPMVKASTQTPTAADAH